MPYCPQCNAAGHLHCSDPERCGNTKPMRLGRFGHHPDRATDFEVECDALMGLAYDAEHGMADRAAVVERMARALEFRVGGVPSCVNAKETLRERFNSLNFDK